MNEKISNIGQIKNELGKTKESLEKDYLGIIIDSNDPEFLGRCKIRVFEKYDDIKDEDLPWSYPGNYTKFSGGGGGFGEFSYPKKNHLVKIKFNDGDIYKPIYYSIERINDTMKEEIKASYENCQVLVYDEDEDMKILYTLQNGLMIWLKESFINITPGGEKIIEKSPNHYINSPNVMVGEDASHPDTKCDEIMSLLIKMATAIDLKYPPSPGKTIGDVQKAQDKVCSKIVKIAD